MKHLALFSKGSEITGANLLKLFRVNWNIDEKFKPKIRSGVGLIQKKFFFWGGDVVQILTAVSRKNCLGARFMRNLIQKKLSVLNFSWKWIGGSWTLDLSAMVSQSAGVTVCASIGTFENLFAGLYGGRLQLAAECGGLEGGCPTKAESHHTQGLWGWQVAVQVEKPAKKAAIVWEWTGVSLPMIDQ